MSLAANKSSPVIYLVDDDDSMRASLAKVLQHAGYAVRAFASSSAFLTDYDAHEASCLIFDLEMPEMSGLELWKSLIKDGKQHPLIMITGYGTVHCAVEAMQLGAVDFIEKPFHHEDFLAVVSRAIASDTKEREHRLRADEIGRRVTSLTLREKEVLDMVVDGQLSKQIAKTLGISVKTVEVHRSNITKKMGVQSVAQLVRLMTEYASIRNRLS